MSSFSINFSLKALNRQRIKEQGNLSYRSKLTTFTSTHIKNGQFAFFFINDNHNRKRKNSNRTIAPSETPIITRIITTTTNQDNENIRH